MKKIDVKMIYSERLNQIDMDLKKEYRRGTRKDKQTIAKLLHEKGRLEKIINNSKDNPIK